MKAGICYGPRDLRIEERPIPEPAPDEVLIRVGVAGICGGDVDRFLGRRPWPSGPNSFSGLEEGHELAGEVVGFGSDVLGFELGQRVGVEPKHLVGCQRCRLCRAGRTHLCPERGLRQGSPHRSHGFSEYDTCRAANAHRLPDHVTLEGAALLDCYACAVHAANRAGLTPASTVVVLGTGAIGMAVGQVTRAMGARQVIMVGRRRGPLAIAQACGAADATIACDEDPAKAVAAEVDSSGVDVVFEAVGGEGPTLRQALQIAAPGGQIVVMGMFTRASVVDTAEAFRKELSLSWSNSYSTYNGRSEYRAALDLMASGHLRPAPLVTHRFPLVRITEAFAAAADKRRSDAVKVVVTPAASLRDS